MEIQNSVEDLISTLQDAVNDGRTYIDKLQERMDEIESVKDDLETYVGTTEDVLAALEGMGGVDLESALENATNLVD